MKPLTVGRLRKIIEGIDDNVLVLVPRLHHSYREASAVVATALLDPESEEWSEDHGEEVTPSAEYGERVEVVIVR